MSLSGTGVASTTPDMATLTSGVVTHGKTAREALTANNVIMSNLVDTIKAAGIADKDIRTSGFAVHPQYSRHDSSISSDRNRPPGIVGYQVSNNVTVRLHNLEKLGIVLDQMVTAGSNTVNGIRFGVAEPKPLQDKARRLAMADALDKATLYSNAAGVCLSRIKTIAEHGGHVPEQPIAMRTMAMDEMQSAVPVQAGEVGFTATVAVTWEVANAPCS